MLARLVHCPRPCSTADPSCYVSRRSADHHEALDLYRPVRPPHSSLLHGQNQWPLQPPSFRPTMESWIAKMHVIGLALIEATAQGLGLTADEWAHLRGLVADSFWVMRCIGYPSLPEGADGISCGAHKGERGR